MVFALVRCGSLVLTDTFWVEGMDEWKPLSEAFPPSPSHTKPATFLGREDDESTWTFYCRDGYTVVGPRPIDEVEVLMFLGFLDDDHLVFLAGCFDRWMSVADLIRTVDKETPGYAESCNRMRAAARGVSSNSAMQPQRQGEDFDWLQTGLNLTAISPHIGGAYLGYKAVKRFTKWFDDSNNPGA